MLYLHAAFLQDLRYELFEFLPGLRYGVGYQCYGFGTVGRLCLDDNGYFDGRRDGRVNIGFRRADGGNQRIVAGLFVTHQIGPLIPPAISRIDGDVTACRQVSRFAGPDIRTDRAQMPIVTDYS